MAKSPVDSSPVTPRKRGWLLLCIATLALTLGILFAPSFKPGWTHFNNDGPLGALKTEAMKTPDAFSGVWLDLNWIGNNGGSLTPSLTFLKFFILGPIGFSKFHAPAMLLILGVCMFLACRALGLSPPVALLAGIAAALNMNFFSNACWGLSSWPGSVAMAMLAIGALGSASRSCPWVRSALAGLAVGMGILNGSDVGIILSLFVGLFGLFHVIYASEGRATAKSAMTGIGQMALVVVCSVFMAWNNIDVLLFRAKVLDAVASQQEAMTPDQRWDWATQWSLPKSETFRFVIPGLHGYRMDTPEGGRYWGAAGQTPGWQESKQGIPRFSGSGEYTGVTVVLLALFAVLLALRKDPKALTPTERRIVWFWAAAALVSILLAWGRYGPLYGLIHSFPVFSSMRNPIKWTHGYQLSAIMLFAYGLQGLWRVYIDAPTRTGAPKTASAKPAEFEKLWLRLSMGLLGASVLGWILYSTSTGDLTKYLLENAVAQPTEAAESVARDVARHSQREVGLFLVVLAASLGFVWMAMRGKFSGGRSTGATLVLGLLLLVDLARANTPWVQHFDYRAKYAPNALTDFLSQHRSESRVTIAPFSIPQLANLQQIYHGEWMQQQFPYYNIPSIDVVQDPRPLPENIAFRSALGATNLLRLWELTSTRYVIGLAGQFADMLNQQVDGNRGRFSQVMGFNLHNAGKGLIGVTRNDEGPFAVLEFAGALPRANLYHRWSASAEDSAILKRLADPAFDPTAEVMVSGTLSSATNAIAPPGKARITSYAPKRIELKTDAASAAILMLTDKHDPNWKVSVDGADAGLLRCNFLFRGVQVPAGQHTVLFEFKPTLTPLYVSSAAILLALVLIGVMAAGWRRAPEPDAP